MMARARHRLLAQAHGFSEIHSYSWFDELWLSVIGYQPGETLEIANPSVRQNIRMRTTLMPNLLAVVKKNAPLRDRFRIFELGRVYFPLGERDRKEINFLSGADFQHERSSPLEESSLSVLKVRDGGLLTPRHATREEFALKPGQAIFDRGIPQQLRHSVLTLLFYLRATHRSSLGLR